MASLLRRLASVPSFLRGQKLHRTISTHNFKFSEEVLAAKETGKPLVALESTIITHGMPFPQNLETALQVEQIIRDQGAIPATIAILKGSLHVGLSQNQIEYLSQVKNVVKASRRDLAPILASGLDGATTVAGTIIAAELADIPVFVTGGVGGVHREGETTMDVSADLTELGRSKTMVVCSGVKSILDIGRTLEYLETQGVCVCTFGETKEFPAFYTRRSGFQAPYNVTDGEQAANIYFAARRLNLHSGILIAVPVPEQYAMDESTINRAIEKALCDAKSNGIKGKAVTPFILDAVSKVTAGASLKTNIALIKNNAEVGAKISVELSRKWKINNKSQVVDLKRRYHTSSCLNKGHRDYPMFQNQDVDAPVLVVGGANVDRTYRISENSISIIEKSNKNPTNSY